MMAQTEGERRPHNLQELEAFMVRTAMDSMVEMGIDRGRLLRLATAGQLASRLAVLSRDTIPAVEWAAAVTGVELDADQTADLAATAVLRAARLILGGGGVS